MRVTHGACGKTWKQKGNKSGHCDQCHDTYYGITAFDAHQHQPSAPNQQIVCERKGEWWQDEDGQWHKGRRLTEAEKREIWG